MLRRLLIVGAGGHGRSIAEAALLSGRWNEIAFIDDRYPQVIETAGWPVVGDVRDASKLAERFQGVVVALGDNKKRAHCTQALEDAGVSMVSIVHPKAFVSVSARLGPGCTVMAGAVVGADAELGRGCIVNANACADHDTCMEDYAHLGVGVCLAGGVNVGEGAFLQAGCYGGYKANFAAWTVFTPETVLKSTAL